MLSAFDALNFPKPCRNVIHTRKAGKAGKGGFRGDILTGQKERGCKGSRLPVRPI